MDRFYWLRSLGLVALFLVGAEMTGAAQMAVRHPGGSLRGFLEVRSQAGARLGYAEVNQTMQGDVVTNHMVYRFTDGSVDEETTIFKQGKEFVFVSDHHVQHGPFFKKPADMLVEANGQVTSRSVGKDGKVKVDTDHIDLGPEFANGLVGTILENVPASTGEFKLGQVVATPKPRLIKLDVTRDGQESFRIAGVTKKADIFRLKIELGGVVGVIAPLVGKQPADILISVVEGDAPCIVRIVQTLAEDTPVVDVQLAGTTFAKGSAAKK